jgi:hypothetical protein
VTPSLTLLGSNNAGLSITGVSAPANSRVFFVVEDFTTAFALTGMSAAGGLTWVIDRNGASDQNCNVGILSADCPAGTSNVTLTATLTGSTVPCCVCFALTEIATGSSGYLSGTPPAPTTVFTTAAWATPSITTADNDAVVIGLVGADGTTPLSSVPTSGTEIYDIHNTGTTESLTVVYRVVSGIAGYTTTGNWSAAAGESRRATVAYKIAAAAPAGGTVFRREGPRFVRN